MKTVSVLYVTLILAAFICREYLPLLTEQRTQYKSVHCVLDRWLSSNFTPLPPLCPPLMLLAALCHLALYPFPTLMSPCPNLLYGFDLLDNLDSFTSFGSVTRLIKHMLSDFLVTANQEIVGFFSGHLV